VPVAGGVVAAGGVEGEGFGRREQWGEQGGDEQGGQRARGQGAGGRGPRGGPGLVVQGGEHQQGQGDPSPGRQGDVVLASRARARAGAPAGVGPRGQGQGDAGVAAVGIPGERAAHAVAGEGFAQAAGGVVAGLGQEIHRGAGHGAGDGRHLAGGVALEDEALGGGQGQGGEAVGAVRSVSCRSMNRPGSRTCWRACFWSTRPGAGRKRARLLQPHLRRRALRSAPRTPDERRAAASGPSIWQLPARRVWGRLLFFRQRARHWRASRLSEPF